MPRLSFLLRLPVVLLLAHVYVALRLGQAAPAAQPWVTALVLTLIYGLILGGFFVRRSTGSKGGDALAWAGFLCLGLFSWLFVLTVLRDILLLLLAGISWSGAFVRWDVSLWTSRAVPWLALLAVVIGFINARRVARVHDVTIAVPGLPSALQGFRIVQLSDVHVGPTIKAGYVNAIVDAANALQPDVIALTGDLVDGSVVQLQRHTHPFGRLVARHGVYAVTGNHEYYSGARQWVAELQRLGIDVLMNEHRVLHHRDERLVLAGVTDFNAAAFDPEQASNPQAAAANAPAGVPRVLLAHQPRSAPAAQAAGFDVQLSGHTHGGQFWPWNFFVPLQQPFVAGLHRLGSLQVYVSRGTGYWGPPMRLGARSEITRIRLVKAG